MGKKRNIINDEHNNSSMEPRNQTNLSLVFFAYGNKETLDIFQPFLKEIREIIRKANGTSNIDSKIEVEYPDRCQNDRKKTEKDRKTKKNIPSPTISDINLDESLEKNKKDKSFKLEKSNISEIESDSQESDSSHGFRKKRRSNCIRTKRIPPIKKKLEEKLSKKRKNEKKNETSSLDESQYVPFEGFTVN